MTSPDTFREDLLWQANRALELGRTLCACEGRHHWSYAVLRAAGITSSIGAEEPVLASLVAPLIGDRARVMIAGSADLGLLCFVGRYAGERRPRITVIDKCKAPLSLIEEFIEGRGIDCRTLHTDLRTLNGREQWDNILVHHTSEFFDAPSRVRFFEAIAASLAPGGSLVCVTMAGRTLAPEKQAELEAEFRDSSLSAFRRTPMAGQEQAAEFERLIGDYAKARAARRMGYPDGDESYEVLRQARLKIVSEHPLPVKWTFSKVDSTPDSLRKFVIVATRD
jgi:SAM-dependent methyltransferase